MEEPPVTGIEHIQAALFIPDEYGTAVGRKGKCGCIPMIFKGPDVNMALQAVSVNCPVFPAIDQTGIIG
jgi:hypothetical protein